MWYLPVSTSTSTSAKPATNECVDAVARVRVARDAHQPLPGERRRRRFRERVDVVRQLVAVVLAAELDRLLRRLRQRHAAAGARDALVRDGVLLGRAAVHLRGDLLQLLDRVGGRRVRRARVRVRRLAAARHAAPRQVLARCGPR